VIIALMERCRGDRHHPVARVTKVAKVGAVKTGRNWCRSEQNDAVSCMTGLLESERPGCPTTARIPTRRKEAAREHANSPYPKSAKPELSSRFAKTPSRASGAPRTRSRDWVRFAKTPSRTSGAPRIRSRDWVRFAESPLRPRGSRRAPGQRLARPTGSPRAVRPRRWVETSPERRHYRLVRRRLRVRSAQGGLPLAVVHPD